MPSSTKGSRESLGIRQYFIAQPRAGVRAYRGGNEIDPGGAAGRHRASHALPKGPAGRLPAQPPHRDRR